MSEISDFRLLVIVGLFQLLVCHPPHHMAFYGISIQVHGDRTLRLASRLLLSFHTVLYGLSVRSPTLLFGYPNEPNQLCRDLMRLLIFSGKIAQCIVHVHVMSHNREGSDRHGSLVLTGLEVAWRTQLGLPPPLGRDPRRRCSIHYPPPT
jgi:hypothetical protein